MVLYNHSGSNVSATFLDRSTAPLPFVVDVKLYCIVCGSRKEGHYLAAVLNSSTVDDRIKPFQSLGLAGERDIHKKVFDLPIPKFSPQEKLHGQISKLGEKAANEVGSLVSRSNKLPKSLARRRAYVREEISERLRQINLAVKKLV